jgi:hypothetical protein
MVFSMIQIFDRWLLLAIYVSAGPFLVFAHGLFGAGSGFTGLFLVATTLGLLLVGQWSDSRPNACDTLFAAFAACVGVSFLKNGIGNPKEFALLLITLAAYPVGRTFAGHHLTVSFVAVTSIVVAMGVVATGIALSEQWNDSRGKPYVFGEFAAAPAQFTISLSILVIGMLCMRTSGRRAGAGAVLLLIASAVFAASVVRFAFVAFAIALAVAAMVARPRERLLAVLALGVMVTGVALGNIARSDTTIKFARYAVVVVADMVSSSVATPSATYPTSVVPESTGSVAVVLAASSQPVGADQGSAPATCGTVESDNSIAIRRQLYSEAAGLLPAAGLFGIGLSRFMERSCFPDAEIHNSLLQAFVEVGWIGGAVLALLALLAIASLVPIASTDDEARFALCGMVFVLAMAMAHGSICRDVLLFAFLGYAANVLSRKKIPSRFLPSKLRVSA